MWNVIMERVPTLLETVCILLALLIPYVTYKINQKLHTDMDPPWKQEEKDKEKSGEQPAK